MVWREAENLVEFKPEIIKTSALDTASEEEAEQKSKISRIYRGL